ncbi:hypothetical protein V8G54_031841 [Vigna mungo]|uniref:Uncharacterized protein n=1 Tax=Vigna mungo TaxID=3915 RepID=A0AAQ3ML59_VIGMU
MSFILKGSYDYSLPLFLGSKSVHHTRARSSITFFFLLRRAKCVLSDSFSYSCPQPSPVSSSSGTSDLSLRPPKTTATRSLFHPTPTSQTPPMLPPTQLPRFTHFPLLPQFHKSFVFLM